MSGPFFHLRRVIHFLDVTNAIALFSWQTVSVQKVVVTQRQFIVILPVSNHQRTLLHKIRRKQALLLGQTWHIHLSRFGGPHRTLCPQKLRYSLVMD